MDLKSVHIIYASTSGHTEYVAQLLTAALRDKLGQQVSCTRAEESQLRSLTECNVLVLAAATWNTGGVEGQLNPHMAELLDHRASNADLYGKACACVALGDDRYYYTARAADHLERYVVSHGGYFAVPVLKLINEPYGQEDIVRRWASALTHVVASRTRS